MILALALSAVAAECPAPVPATELVGKLAEAEAAYEQLDVAKFRDAMDETVLMVPCLDEILGARQASRLHTLTGLARFVEGQDDRAEQSFAAARATSGGGEVLRRLVPEGHAVWDLYGAIPLNAAPHAHLAEPSEGTVHLDGLETLQRPERWSTLFQYRGETSTTAYLFPGDAPPAYPAKVPAVVTTTPVPEPPATREPKGSKVPGWIAVGVGGAAATGLAVAGAVRESAFLKATDPLTQADADAASRGVNTTYSLAAVVGGLSAAGAVAVIAW